MAHQEDEGWKNWDPKNSIAANNQFNKLVKDDVIAWLDNNPQYKLDPGNPGRPTIQYQNPWSTRPMEPLPSNPPLIS